MTVDGQLRGTTPLAAEVPAGVRHEINMSLRGYAPWQQDITGEPGQTLPVHARLQSESVRVTVEGEPHAAHVFIAGRDEGATPRVLQLSAAPHQITVSKPGWASYRVSLSAAAGLERRIEYHLLSAEAAADALPASILFTQSGYALQRVPAAPAAAPLAMPDDRNKPARVGSHSFYLGMVAVNNEQFRHFRVNYAASAAGPAGMSGSGEPVAGVSWEDAVSFCKWLSEQDSLPPAYERSGNGYVLRKPGTLGYRLPTGAELQYALATAAVAPAPGLATEWVNDHAAETVNASAAARVGFRVARDMPNSKGDES